MQVWKGRWNERDVAVKELLMPATAKSSAEEEADATHAFLSFQKEVAVMCKLQHPNLLRLYGVMLRPLRMVLGKAHILTHKRSQCSSERDAEY